MALETKRVGARERIIEAFWNLLEENDTSELTVGMIVAAAGCNRGSFYYHFENLDEMVETVARETLIDDFGLLSTTFSLVASSGLDDEATSLDPRFLKRTALFMDRGGAELIVHEAESYITNIWKTLLCLDGEDLSTHAQLVVGMTTIAVLSMMRNIGRAGRNGEHVEIPFQYLSEMSELTIEEVASAQGVEKDEILKRIALYDSYFNNRN